MKIMSTTYPNTKKQSGFAIITAVFLLVILALLGQGMVSLLATSQQSINHEVASAKAYMAARTCLQWGMYQAAFANPAGPYTNTFNDPTSNLFNNTCTTDTIMTNADGLIYYDINAVGEFGSTANPEYSRRELHLQFRPLL